MKMHEVLWLISEVHDHTAAAVSNKGDWCWPTRELLAENVMLNRDLFPGSDDVRKQIQRARERGWIVEGGCSPHCHARHLKLTTVGQEALKLMNEGGCGGGRECIVGGAKLTRKVA